MDDAAIGELVDWLKQAVMDYETQTYRPSAHYLLLFQRSIAAIAELRAEVVEVTGYWEHAQRTADT
jgi:hypothetical protein